MSKTIIERDFWNDEKVIDEFSPEDKLFMMYLLTCPRGNPIGIYKIPIKIIAFEIGYSPEAVRVLLDRFETKYKKIVYDYEEQEIAILSTLKHTINRGGKPIEEMVTKKLDEVVNANLIIKVYDHMHNWWDLSNREIDKTIKNIFEQEIKKREELISYTNTYINTYTNTNTNTYSGTDSVDDSEECSNINDDNKNTDSGNDSDNDSWKKQVISEWNKLDKNIPKIKTLNASTDRYKMLKARINENGLDKVLEAIRCIENSQFLQGYRTSFVITFDWFVRPNNFIKVLEGNYADKQSQEPKREQEHRSNYQSTLSESELRKFEELKKEVGL